MDNIFFVKKNIHKSIFSIIAWFVYIILLWGHFREGVAWEKVVIFNLIGAIILTLAFLGNRLLQELSLLINLFILR